MMRLGIGCVQDIRNRVDHMVEGFATRIKKSVQLWRASIQTHPDPHQCQTWCRLLSGWGESRIYKKRMAEGDSAPLPAIVAAYSGCSGISGDATSDTAEVSARAL